MSPEQYRLPKSQVDGVSFYLDCLDLDESRVADEISKEIKKDGMPIADTIVAIPVAAHQEAPRVYNTLSYYARQIDCKPFTIVLGLNSPMEGVDSQEVLATIREVERAKKDFPNLDVRSYFMAYHNVAMGKIRRDLWNGICARALEDGMDDLSRPTICLNQDIDAERISPNTIKVVQQVYNESYDHELGEFNRPVKSVSLSHASDPRYPNISRVVGWRDYIYRKTLGSYEAGYVIPLYFYAQREGFNPKDNIGEVQRSFSYDDNYYLPELISGPYVLTSMRRYLGLMPEHGLKVWGSNDLFSPTDSYRTRTEFNDMSSGEATEMIWDGLYQDMEKLMQATMAYFSRRIMKAGTAIGAEELMKHEFERMRVSSTNALRVFGATDEQVQVLRDGMFAEFDGNTADMCARYVLGYDDFNSSFFGEQPYLGVIVRRGRSNLNLVGYLGSILAGT